MLSLFFVLGFATQETSSPPPPDLSPDSFLNTLPPPSSPPGLLAFMEKAFTDILSWYRYNSDGHYSVKPTGVNVDGDGVVTNVISGDESVTRGTYSHPMSLDHWMEPSPSPSPSPSPDSRLWWIEKSRAPEEHWSSKEELLTGNKQLDDKSLDDKLVYQEALHNALLGEKDFDWKPAYACTAGRSCRDRLLPFDGPGKDYFFYEGKFEAGSFTQQVIEESCNTHPRCVTYEFSEELGVGFMCSTTRTVDVATKDMVCTTNAFGRIDTNDTSSSDDNKEALLWMSHPVNRAASKSAATSPPTDTKSVLEEPQRSYVCSKPQFFGCRDRLWSVPLVTERGVSDACSKHTRCVGYEFSEELQVGFMCTTERVYWARNPGSSRRSKLCVAPDFNDPVSMPFVPGWEIGSSNNVDWERVHTLFRDLQNIMFDNHLRLDGNKDFLGIVSAQEPEGIRALINLDDEASRSYRTVSYSCNVPNLVCHYGILHDDWYISEPRMQEACKSLRACTGYEYNTVSQSGRMCTSIKYADANSANKTVSDTTKICVAMVDTEVGDRSYDYEYDYEYDDDHEYDYGYDYEYDSKYDYDAVRYSTLLQKYGKPLQDTVPDAKYDEEYERPSRVATGAEVESPALPPWLVPNPYMVVQFFDDDCEDLAQDVARIDVGRARKISSISNEVDCYDFYVQTWPHQGSFFNRISDHLTPRGCNRHLDGVVYNNATTSLKKEDYYQVCHAAPRFHYNDAPSPPHPPRGTLNNFLAAV